MSSALGLVVAVRVLGEAAQESLVVALTMRMWRSAITAGRDVGVPAAEADAVTMLTDRSNAFLCGR